MGNQKKKTWQEFEELIYDIYKELEPIADVKKNDFIEGFESGIKREIDISIRTKVANHEILIIIQAKNFKKAADINVIGEFASVIKDVRASKGILICNAGFTKAAKEYATKRKIDLCTAHDASKINWKTEIQIPVIKKSVKVNLTIKHSYVILDESVIDGMKMPYPYDLIIEFLNKWEKDEISKEPGKHTLFFDREKYDIKNEHLMPIMIGIDYKIEHRYHFKFFIPTDYKGIMDYFTKNFTPAFIEFKETIPFLDDGTWKYVSEPTEISVQTSHLKIEIMKIDFFKKKMIRMEWMSK